MGRAIRLLLLLGVLSWAAPLHALDRSACKQYGGATDCWSPVVGDWKYGTCGEVGAFTSYTIAVCTAQGGTWSGSTCTGLPPPEYRRPTSEGDISPFAQDIFSNFHGPLCDGPSAGGWSWGGVFGSVNCGNANGAVISSTGYEIGNRTTQFPVTGKKLQGAGYAAPPTR